MTARKEYPLRIKLLAWASLTSVQIISSSILKLANHHGKYSFSPQSSLTISETLKCILSIVYLMKNARRNTSRQFEEQSSRPLILHMAALAGIYCLNNGIMFHLFAHADPGSITLIKSGATVVSAFMMYYTRKFRLSMLRWVVILLQMLGLIIAQYDSCTGKPHLKPLIYLLLFISLFNSSLANVWNEHVIKFFENASLATKNIYLYFFGALFNYLIYLHQRHTSTAPGFWEGYGWAGVGVVISNAFMGLAINLVYKYADAVVKNIATTSTTVVLLILSAAFFDGRTDFMVFIGAGVVVLSTYLYFSIGAKEELMRELKEKRGSVILKRDENTANIKSHSIGKL